MRANPSRWNRTNIAWLAGILEGEGCFSTWTNTTNKLGLHIALNMTDEDVVRRAHEVMGMGTVRGPLYDKRGPFRPYWRLNIYRREHVYALCAAIYPFMGQRRATKIRELIAAWVKDSGVARLRKRR